jgi:hypothetical protein
MLAPIPLAPADIRAGNLRARWGNAPGNGLAILDAETSNACAYILPLPFGLPRSRSGSTRGAISSEFHTRDGNPEPTVLLHLFFQVVEESTFKLRDSATTQTRHVHRLARRLTLVKTLLALEMHQIEFINQAVSLQESQGPIDRDANDFWLLLLRLAQYLCCIEMRLAVSVMPRIARRCRVMRTPRDASSETRYPGASVCGKGTAGPLSCCNSPTLLDGPALPIAAQPSRSMELPLPLLQLVASRLQRKIASFLDRVIRNQFHCLL